MSLSNPEARHIAINILEQLGGNKFKAMTGATLLCCGQDGSLGLKFKGCRKYAFLSVHLNALDLYNMTFYSIRKNKLVNKKTIENVYFDRLRDIFTQETGLDTSL